ncbi:ATP-binding protein [Actinomadura logoneensis]|uniref:ATP-binding protein n=1 Tax=Actinomadura logoneensis TaxID=2293572 RepID=A0A372JHV7_9ACTN|nr:ATP-binding protein [Actinomadura logoneensis]RFU39540.1 ATP-binding protein [Actinomadura logoneensis]
MPVQITPCSPTPQLAIDRDDQEGVKGARDFLSDLLQALGVGDVEVIYIGKTIATELITNAVRHTATASVLMRVYVGEDGRPVIEVEDDSDARPRARPLTLDESSGRGLALVEGLAACWGWALREGGGKIVWAVLDVVVP